MQHRSFIKHCSTHLLKYIFMQSLPIFILLPPSASKQKQPPSTRKKCCFKMSWKTNHKSSNILRSSWFLFLWDTQKKVCVGRKWEWTLFISFMKGRHYLVTYAPSFISHLIWNIFKWNTTVWTKKPRLLFQEGWVYSEHIKGKYIIK